MPGQESSPTSGRPTSESRVVVGYNGKEPSRRALVWAAEQAVRREAPLLVVYAANYPGMTLPPGPGLLDPEPGALEAAQEVTTRGVAEALIAQPGLEVAGATEVTSPSKSLIEVGRRAWMLVVGSRGRGPAAGALLGSVSFTVAAGASCPVVVVKDEPRERPLGPEYRVVVGTDGSEEAEVAVSFAADRAFETAAQLEVVTCTGGEQAPLVDRRRLWAEAEHIADSARHRLSGSHPGLTVTTRVEDCPAERALVDASRDAGLLVVGTRGRGAFHGWLLGSVSHAVIHGASCPVAVCGDEAAPS